MKRHIVVLAFLLGSSMLNAQDTRGSIAGTLRDTSGAVVPQVAVVVTNVDTNVATKSVTNDEGYYEVPLLVSGMYRVEASASGFRRYSQAGIEVSARRQARIDITLSLGDVAESVSVTADAPLIDTTTASAGTILDSKRVLELPIVSNNVFMATTLTPGVTNDQGTFGARLTDRTAYAPRVGGGGYGSSEFSLDGTTSSLGGRGTNTSFIPPLWAVQEFKMETTPFDASLGGGIGGQFSAVTKSGTNQYRGTVYWNHRQNRLNATSWSVNRQFYQDVAAGRKNANDQKQASGHTNDFGISVGGPVQFATWKDGRPSVWNGTNRLFFFFNYHGSRSGGPQQRYYRIPTDVEKSGNFSELLARGGSQFQIYDPATGRVVGDKVVRQPFSGNIIPSSRISPIAQAYMKLYPAANNMGTPAFDLADNYFSWAQRNREGLNSFINRWDYNVADRHRTFVRWFHNRWDQTGGDWTGNGLMDTTNWVGNTGVSADWVWAKSAGTMYNFKAVWAMHTTNQVAGGFGLDPAAFGFAPYLAQRAGDKVHLPQINLRGMQGFATGTEALERYHVYQVNGSVMKVAGSHTIRAGVDVRQYQYHEQKPALAAGGFDFGNNYTKSDSGATARNIGFDLAAFLLGQPNGGTINRNSFFSVQDNLYVGYLQDDWRVTSRLTLNLGVRYELPTPSTEWHNRIVRAFDEDAVLPISRTVEANYARNPLAERPASDFVVRGGARFAGIDGEPRTMYNYDKNGIMPRLGFAYQITPKLVFRGGYAIFTESNRGVQSIRGGSTYGFSQSTPFVASDNNGETFRANLADPFPATLPGSARFLEPVGTALGVMQNVGGGYWSYDTDRKHVYSHRVRGGFQYALGKDWMTEFAYVGSWIRDMDLSLRPNAVPGKYWNTSPVRNDALANDLNRTVANPLAGLVPGMGLNTANTNKAQLLRPFPHMQTLNLEQVGGGTSKFDSIEGQLQKRFSQGYTLGVAFSGSKQFTDVIVNEFDTTPTRYIDNWFKRVAINGIYDLPYGRGRKFGAKSHLLLDTVLGGWSLSGIYQYQVRGPLTFGSNYLFSGDWSSLYIQHGQTTPERKFNVDAGFNRIPAQQPAAYTVRLNPFAPDVRIPFRDPTNQMDVSVLKSFHITERHYFRLKVDAFNIANHPIFNNAVVDPLSSQFGQASGFGTNSPMRNFLFSAQFFF